MCSGRSSFSFCLSPITDQDADSEEHALVGQGSFKLEGSWLKLRQFHGLIVKRFHCAKRNTKALFSQILLPAFFVCVAMTVALSVPEIGMSDASQRFIPGYPSAITPEYRRPD